MTEPLWEQARSSPTISRQVLLLLARPPESCAIDLVVSRIALRRGERGILEVVPVVVEVEVVVPRSGPACW